MFNYFFKINLFLFLIFFIQFIISNCEDFITKINGNSNNGKNNYYITLYLDEQKKPQSFLLDTLGSLISSQCIFYSSQEQNPEPFMEMTKEKDIINCKNNIMCSNYPFSSCNKSKCEFEYKYNNSTLKGIYVKKNIAFLEKGESRILPIGCTLSESNEFLEEEIDGILGINSDNNSFIELLYKEKIISSKKFSICLNQKDGGYFSFGQINENYYNDKKNQKYKNIIPNYIPYNNLEKGNYGLEINSLSIKERNNILSNGVKLNCVIDSKSVKTYFNEYIYNNLINEILSYCLGKKGNCKNIQKIENYGYCSNFKSKQEIIKSINKYWPTIILGFQKYNHTLSPENYFVAYSSEGKIKACIGLEKTNKDFNILGTTFLNGYNIIFDNENKKIGFIETNCQFNENNIENEDYINRVFDDPVNIIIVTLSIGGIIILFIILIILYKILYQKTPTRKGYVRQVDINNSTSDFMENRK